VLDIWAMISPKHHQQCLRANEVRGTYQLPSNIG
jgi:hypothetical protein